MVSKIIMRSILAVSLVFFMGTTVRATISGTSTTQTSCTSKNHLLGLCSINVEGILKGLGNVTKDPTAFTVAVLIEGGSVFCKNPAGNSIEGNGVPFTELQVELSASDLIDANQISRNGKALSDIPFHDDVLIQAIEAALTAQCDADPQSDACTQLEQLPCQHSNWVQTVVLTKLQVLGQQFTDDSKTEPNTCDIDAALISGDFSNCLPRADALGTKCDAPAAVLADPKSFVWKAFTYACTESCHNKTGTICPDDLSPPLP